MEATLDCRFEMMIPKDWKGTCPYCGLYVLMSKVPLAISPPWSSSYPWNNLRANELNLCISKCPGCKEIAIWHGEKLIIPAGSIAPIPNKDMPEDIKKNI